MIKKTKISTEDNLKTIDLSIVVVALAKYRNGKPGLFIVVDFKDVDGKKRRLMIPASIVNDLRALKKLLIDNCFGYSLTKEAWSDIKAILNKTPDERMQLVENPGFHNGVFLQSNNKIIGKITDGQWRPILDPTSKVRFPMVERKGKLEDWQLNVAASGLYSSRIMLVVAASFSASLLKMGVDLFGQTRLQ